MKRGTQIAYVPPHARASCNNDAAIDDINHSDVQFGFVTSRLERNHAHYCRYWLQGKPGELRTVSCSELTPDDALVKHQSVSQFIVKRTLDRIYATRAK